MRYLRLVSMFLKVSLQQEMAYRENFTISLLYSLFNLVTGVGGVLVLFSQVETLHGWTLPATLALLGVYLILGSVRGLVFGPSLNTLIGMDGEVWTGRLDYTLLRPVNLQFMASLRQWHPLALVDLMLGVGVILAAALQPGAGFDPANLPGFGLALAAAVIILYSILLVFSALVFYSPGFLFTWVFDALFEMARYPVGIYPGLMRVVLTWVVPVGLMTSLPAQALTGGLPLLTLLGSLGFALLLCLAASWLFRTASRAYSSASS
jgi:ABC-2 type transport system permease protein